METTFSAPGISCRGCAGSIETALGAVSGVSGVSVDVAAKVVTVSHDEGVGPEELGATLARAGNPATPEPGKMALRVVGARPDVGASGPCCCGSTRRGR